MLDEKVNLYDALLAKCLRFERKGKSVPHTTANGYMFSLVNKEGQIGIRFSKETQAQYIESLNTSLFKSHNAVMKGYILITDRLLEDLDNVAVLRNESFDYVQSLKPK